MIEIQDPICHKCKHSLADIPSGKPCPNCGDPARDLGFRISEAVGFSDHATGTGLRVGQPFAFSESERREFTRYAHVEADGTVRFDLKGFAPRNEDDSDVACRILVEALNTHGIEAKYIGTGPKDDDHFIDIRGKRFGVQVTRTLLQADFWRTLGIKGQVGPMCIDVSVAVAALRGAIERKSIIPPGQRPSMFLLLDAYRVPTAALGVVATEFIRLHSSWAAELGFKAIYVVGPSVTFVHRLAGPEP